MLCGDSVFVIVSVCSSIRFARILGLINSTSVAISVQQYHHTHGKPSAECMSACVCAIISARISMIVVASPWVTWTCVSVCLFIQFSREPRMHTYKRTMCLINMMKTYAYIIIICSVSDTHPTLMLFNTNMPYTEQRSHSWDTSRHFTGLNACWF